MKLWPLALSMAGCLHEVADERQSPCSGSPEPLQHLGRVGAAAVQRSCRGRAWKEAFRLDGGRDDAQEEAVLPLLFDLRFHFYGWSRGGRSSTGAGTSTSTGDGRRRSRSRRAESDNAAGKPSQVSPSKDNIRLL